MWLAFTITFIALIVAKNALIDSLMTGDLMKDMYSKVQLVELPLFTVICPNKVKVQDCSTDEKNAIFRNGIPGDIYFDVASWMEREFSCNSFSGVTLTKLCFSDYHR